MKDIISEIIKEFEFHSTEHINHNKACDRISLKYKEALSRLNKGEDISEFQEWNKYYAPRIIYEGIGNKKILALIEELNNLY